MRSETTQFGNEHVDIRSYRNFDATVRALEAELGSASSSELMTRLKSSSDWDGYASQCGALAGPSGLIKVGRLDWGEVLTLSGTPMRACCIIIGNPLTARRLLAAGGARVGLYLPTKILIFEDQEGDVHVAYDKFEPIMASLHDAGLTSVAMAIDAVLERLASAAAVQPTPAGPDRPNER